MQSFTREDLLHLRCFAHVSTISRYRYVCAGVRALVDDGKLVEKGRMQLVLAGRSRAFDRDTAGLPLWERYLVAIERLVERQPKDEPFGVMDLVALWSSDPHLTINSKRIAVRDAMRHLLHDEVVIRDDEFTYRRAR